MTKTSRTQDARRILADLRKRIAKARFTVHEEKTRLIEFGRLPALEHRERDERRPEAFAFMGSVHYCACTRDGRF